MSYYERDAAYKALLGDNPDIQAIIGNLNPDDCQQLFTRLGREIPPLQSKLKIFQEAMLEASRKAGQPVDQASAD
jgi:hypothetical protein